MLLRLLALGSLWLLSACFISPVPLLDRGEDLGFAEGLYRRFDCSDQKCRDSGDDHKLSFADGTYQVEAISDGAKALYSAVAHDGDLVLSQVEGGPGQFAIIPLLRAKDANMVAVLSMQDLRIKKGTPAPEIREIVTSRLKAGQAQILAVYALQKTADEVDAFVAKAGQRFPIK